MNELERIEAGQLIRRNQVGFRTNRELRAAEERAVLSDARAMIRHHGHLAEQNRLLERGANAIAVIGSIHHIGAAVAQGNVLLTGDLLGVVDRVTAQVTALV